MSDRNVDPSGNTEAFRAFSSTPAEPEPAANRMPLIIGGVVAAVVIVALVLWLAL